MSSGSILRYNDGSSAQPRLRIAHSLWSLRSLPMNAPVEWTLEEKFSRVKQNGFEAVECWLTDVDEKLHRDALDAEALGLILGHRPFKLEDVRSTVARALRLKADFIFAQPADAFTPVQEVATLIKEGRKIANDNGLALFVEVHRNNFTENLPQIKQLIELDPDIRFTADLSHLIVCGEFYGWEDERAIDRLECVLSRTSHMHGRISNGEAVQVDVGDGSGDTAKFFVRLWASAMRSWLSDATTGDVLQFASELGPPRYAITLPDGSEFSDRWEQSLVMKRLAEEAWTLATDSTD